MKRFLFSLFVLVMAGFTACQQAPGLFDDDDTGISSGFSMKLKAPWTPINTYAPIAPIAGENDIYTLHLVFFERTTLGNGQYKGFYSVDIPSGKPLNMEFPVTVDFSKSPGLSEKEAYSIYLVANLDYYLPSGDIDDWKASLTSLNENEVIEMTKAYVTGEPDESVYVNGDTPLPMSAMAVKRANEGLIDVLLQRAVARFDITNHVKYDYDLMSASIWNGFPYSSIWEGGVDYANTARIERYYGIRNKVDSSNPDGVYQDIFGGLYSFENVVANPEKRDKKTTCMIVGLKNRDASAPDYGKVLYYRINVISTQNGQDLKRNNSYQITIRGVNEKGYNTEREAYEGEDNRLEIVINYWDLDDDGIIQYDGDNVLAVPMKRINVPREGDEREYSIFTIGKGNLTISRNTVPTGIEVKLLGNILYVNSQPLAQNQTERSGEIDLTFGALKATVHIRQSGEISTFLNVTPHELPPFPAYSVTQSGQITVSGSGAWKAKIYNPGFTFTQGSNVQEISSATHGDSFTISTLAANPSNTSLYSFVKISLVDDPEVSRTIVLRQQGQGAISLSPVQSEVRFDPNGSVSAGSNNVFKVNPGDDGGETPQVNEWQAVLADDANFELVLVRDRNDLNANTLTVRAKSQNAGNAVYSTTVKVYLVDQPSIAKTMTVTQGAYNFSVSPKSFSPILAGGGEAGPVTVSGPAGMTWSATVTTNLADHKATVRSTGQTTPVYELRNRSMNEKLYVVFGALAQPNVNPEATVTVTLDGTNLSETFKVTQSNLIPRALKFHSANTKEFTLMHGYSGYNYFKAYGEYLKTWQYFGKEQQSIVKTAGAIAFTQGSTIPAGVTNYHSNEGISTTVRNRIMTWMDSDPRNFLTVCVDNLISDQEATLKRFSSAYALKYAKIKSYTRHTLSNTPAQYRNSKVWEYLTKTGPFTNGVELDLDKVSLYNKGGMCGLNVAITSWPSTAYPVMMNPDNTSQALIVVDPTNRLIAIGDAEIFSYRNSSNNFVEGSANWKFLNNLIAFTVNAGQYGEAFLSQFK